MLGEINQSQNDKKCLIPLVQAPLACQIFTDGKENGSHSGQKEKKWGAVV